MTASIDPIQYLVDRIAEQHPEPAHFIGFELDEWPEGLEEAFLSEGVFKATTRAKAVRCPGCEKKCSKSVVVRPNVSRSSFAAHVECDEEPGHGRIPIDMDDLRRYHASLRTLAQPIISLLDLDAAQMTSTSDDLKLGQINGRNGERDVGVIVTDRRIYLSVGDQKQELAELVSFGIDGLFIDKSHIKRLANRKLRRQQKESAASQVDTSSSSRRSDAIAERNRLIRQYGEQLRKEGKSWQQIAEEIARMPFITSPKNGLKSIKASTVRRIIATPADT